MSGCCPLMRKYCCIIGVWSNCLSFKTFSRLCAGRARAIRNARRKRRIVVLRNRLLAQGGALHFAGREITRSPLGVVSTVPCFSSCAAPAPTLTGICTTLDLPAWVVVTLTKYIPSDDTVSSRLALVV